MLESGTVVSRHATRPCQESSHRFLRGVATPVATAPSRMMSLVQSCVAKDWEILLRPGVREGRNNVLKRSWCASPVFESVQNRFGSSRVIEEQSEGHCHGR